MIEPSFKIPCLEISQPIGTFYIGIIGYHELIQISYADVRRLVDRDVEQYLGIQRPLSKKRVDELQRYVQTIDATFPTSIILAINSEDVEYFPEERILEIKNDQNVAKIIDGQHRIAGLQDFTGSPFDLNVTIFIDMDIEDQAMVFATINLSQTKVSRSLVYDLYEYTKTRSPQKTSHNIAKLLNNRENSPFYQRIKILGLATKPYQPLTQATFVQMLIRLISGNEKQALLDRDLIKRGRSPRRTETKEMNKLVFRDMFLDKKDAEIAKVLWNYFSAVQERWYEAWNGVRTPGNILPRTNGFRALMRFFPNVFIELGGPDQIPSTEDFIKIFQSIELTDQDFNTENFPPGSAGESALLSVLKSIYK